MVEEFRLITKKGDDVSISFDPSSDVRPGDCLTVSDGSVQLAIQAYDVRYGGLKKAIGEFIASIKTPERPEISQYLRDHTHLFKDTWLAKCKIRGHIQDGRLVPGAIQMPAQERTIRKMDEKQVRQLLGLDPQKPARIGTLHPGPTGFDVDLAQLQAVTLITGRKGSGKSHLAKKLLEHLVANGGPVIVLDVNGEYAHLQKSDGNAPSPLSSKITEWKPGENFFIPLDGIPFETFCRMCQIEENHNAYRLFSRYWSENPEGKNLESLRQWVQSTAGHPNTLNAALGRIDYADSLGIFGEFDLGNQMAKMRSGGALVLNMFKLGEKAKQLSIVYLLRQLIEAGLRDEGKIFLFAEEAQNYFEKEFWDDVITRMRHLGIYSIIITNEPTTLPAMVFRQCDNLFCFNFSSENDLTFVAQAQVIDPDTLFMAKNLGLGQCIAIGACTNGFPLVIQTEATQGNAGGQTKLLWG